MRYHQIISDSAHHQRTISGMRKAAAITPHIVDCIGLDRNTLSRPGEFEAAYRERDEWCRKQCPGNYVIKSLGPCPERFYGRQFQFAQEINAILFKMSFC